MTVELHRAVFCLDVAHDPVLAEGRRYGQRITVAVFPGTLDALAAALGRRGIDKLGDLVLQITETVHVLLQKRNAMQFILLISNQD